jgi:hypothetical protein
VVGLDRRCGNGGAGYLGGGGAESAGRQWKEKVMASTDELLAAIPNTEPATFSEFLNALPDVPEKGDRGAWADLFLDLTELESLGLVEIERASRGGSIESLMLTGEGAEAVRRARRG